MLPLLKLWLLFPPFHGSRPEEGERLLHGGKGQLLYGVKMRVSVALAILISTTRKAVSRSTQTKSVVYSSRILRSIYVDYSG